MGSRPDFVSGRRSVEAVRSHIELIGLREMASHITHQCRCSIEKSLEKVKKYGPKLSDDGSGT